MSKSSVHSGGGGSLRSLGDMLESAESVELKVPTPKTGLAGRAHQQARQAGHEAGFAEGLQEGIAQGIAQSLEEARVLRAAELAAFAADLNALREDAADAIERWYREAEHTLAQLATVIAAKVIANELATDPELVLAITREAIQEVTHASSARIRANVLDAPALSRHREELAALAPSLRQVDIVEDPTIRAGCVIETDGGVVEATVEQKLQRALQELRKP
ncbi:MAG: FliH/SctL family protein [Fimbriimonadaceae bacterium]|nr:FliH/SctL family protein [Fimbriimonadaceae bacterium]